MKYYWLVPKGQRHNNWIFSEEVPEVGVRLRERYRPLQCTQCKKIDERSAIRDVAGDVRIRSRSDYLITDDGIVCLSAAIQRFLSESMVEGLQFLSIPGCDDYSIALPASLISTNINKVGMEFHRPCPACGRFRETCFFPALASLTTPSKDLAILCPDVPLEGSRGRKFFYLATQEVVALLRSRKTTGVEYTLAH